MFKRRTPRTTWASLGRTFWPRGGWLRAVLYVVYRIRRLPDPAHKISRGIAVGVFVCFTPFFGLHFLLATGIAWMIGGNMLAALLATFVGNPLTFPIIAGTSVELGNWILGRQNTLPLGQVFDAFSRVSVELWLNARAVFTDEPVYWVHMDRFFELVFLPYLIGGLAPGLVAGMAAYIISRPVIGAYQKGRISRLKARMARRRELIEAERARKEGKT